MVIERDGKGVAGIVAAPQAKALSYPRWAVPVILMHNLVAKIEDAKWGLTVLDRRRQVLLVELARHDVRRYQALASFPDLPAYEHEACLTAWRRSLDPSELR